MPDIVIQQTLEKNTQSVAKIHSQDESLIKGCASIESIDNKLQKYHELQAKENELIALKSIVEDKIAQYNNLQERNNEAQASSANAINALNIKIVWLCTAALSIIVAIVIIKL